MTSIMNNNPQASPTGIVFNIQRYALNDGPGIRTTIFLKGCPLRCRWCQNPESLQLQPESGFRNGAPITIGRSYRISELLNKVKRDAPFYQESGGGVTLSGGEPMLQFEFVRAFLQAAREAGLNTAIETNGLSTPQRYAALLPLLDHIYFDLKLMDPAEHRRLTGVDNNQILENARWLVKSNAPIGFRVPLVTGMTADETNIQHISEFLMGLGIHEVEVCPYQNGWEAKLAWLKTSQSPLGLPSMTDMEVEQARTLFREHGITVVGSG